MYSLLLIPRLPSSGCADRQVTQRRDIACCFTLLVMRIPHIMITQCVPRQQPLTLSLMPVTHKPC